jgi:hypothetical protein
MAFALLIGLTILAAFPASAAEQVPGTRFERHTVEDTLGRTITFYMDSNQRERLPLALIVQGSGCSSVFKRNSAGQLSTWH